MEVLSRRTHLPARHIRRSSNTKALFLQIGLTTFRGANDGPCAMLFCTHGTPFHSTDPSRLRVRDRLLKKLPEC